MPEELENQESSLIGTVARAGTDFAKGMLTFGLMTFAGSLGFKAAGKGFKAAYNAFLKGQAGTKFQASDIYKSLSKTSQMFKSFQEDMKAYKAFTDSEKTRYKDTFKKVQAGQEANTFQKQLDFYKEKASNFIGTDGKFAQRMRGLGYSIAKHTAVDLATFYGVERITGTYDKEAGFGHFLKENIPLSLGFGAVMKGFSPAVNMAKIGITNTVSKNQFLQKVLQRATISTSKVLNSANTNLSVLFESAKESIRYIKKTGITTDTFRGASQAFKAKWKTQKEEVEKRLNPFAGMYKVITEIAEQYLKHSKDSEDQFRKNLFNNILDKYADSKYKQARQGLFKYKGLNLEKYKYSKEELQIAQNKFNEIIEQALSNDKRLKKEQIEDIKNIFKKRFDNINDINKFVDENYYLIKNKTAPSIDNTVVDLRYIHWKNALSKMVNATDRVLTFGAIKPLSYLQIPQTINALKGETIASFTGNKKFNDNILISKNFVLDNIVNNKKIFNNNRIQTDSIFINGQFFSKTTTGELEAITKNDINIRLSTYFGKQNLFIKSILNTSGFNAELANQKNQFNSPILEKFDMLGVLTNEGFIGRQINNIKKLFSFKSPKNFTALWQKAATGSLNDNEIEALSIGMQNIIKYSSNERSTILLRKDVQSNIKVNVNSKSVAVSDLSDKEIIELTSQYLANTSEMTKDLANDLNIEFIYKQIKGTYAPEKILDKTRKSLHFTTEITNRDTLLEFISMNALRDSESQIKTLANTQRISQIEKSILNINLRKKDILNAIQISGDKNNKDPFNKIRNFISEYNSPNLPFNPNKLIKDLKNASIHEDLINIQQDYWKSEFSFSPRNIYEEFAQSSQDGKINSPYRGIERTGYFVMPTSKNPIIMTDPRTGKDVSIGSFRFFNSVINERFNRLLQETGFGLTQALSGNPLNYYKDLFVKRLLPAAAILYGLGTADDIVSSINPIGHRGPSELIADAFVNIRKGFAHLYDLTGITASAKYMEGLMPGSVDSTLSKGLRGFGAPILGSMVAGPVGFLTGLGFSALQGFGFFDMTASSEDINDVYSGRKMVPYKKGRWWVFGQGDFSGSKVETMIPNWYARMKSHYDDTEDLQGSFLERRLFKPLPFIGFNPIGDLIDNGHYAKKHQYSYPTPVTGSPFEEVPFFGPLLGAATSWMPIIGSQAIRENEWKKDLVSRGVPFPGMGTANVSSFQKDGLSNNYTQKTGIGQTIDEMLYQAQEFAGLWGFAGNALIEGLIGSKPFERQQVLESGRSIASMVRGFWDANIGDPMISGLGETIRRINPRSRYDRTVQTINPLTNAQPEWMPDDLERGNVLSKFKMAEIRTPGRAYETLHDVAYTFPVESSYLGLDSQEMVRYMLGLYKKSNLSDFSEMMTTQYNEENKNKDVYNTGLNIHGSYSSMKIVNGVKTLVKYVEVQNSQLENFRNLPLSGQSDVNFLMKQAGAQQAELIYTNNGAILGSDTMRFSQELYNKDIANVEAARIEAGKLLKEGYGFTGQAYSHMDRFKILADIAPYSNEYFREKKFVEQEIKEGNKEIEDDYRTTLRNRKITTNKRELYPYRFRPEGSPLGIKYFKDLVFGESMNMSTYSEENIYNLNENIKSADQYNAAERIVGSLWETISHMDIPFISRFMYYRTPLEDYKRSYLYGRDVKLWEKPYEHWIKPEYEKFRSQENPIGGAIQAGFLSWIFGGFDRTIGTLGAIAGASYGAAHGLFSVLNGSTYIPDRVHEEREINQAFDKLKYDRGKLLYEFTGDKVYLNESKNTIRGLLDTPTDKLTPDSVRRAMYKQEKYYVNAFLDEQNLANKEEILRFVPEDVGAVLTKYWNKRDEEDIEAPQQHIHQQIMDPTSLYVPGINLDDIKYSYIASEGMDNYSFGLGYLDQLNRVNADPNIRNYAEEIRLGNLAPEPITNDTTVIKRRIEGLLNQYNIFSVVEVSNSMNNELRIING